MKFSKQTQSYNYNLDLRKIFLNMRHVKDSFNYKKFLSSYYKMKNMRDIGDIQCLNLYVNSNKLARYFKNNTLSFAK